MMFEFNDWSLQSSTDSRWLLKVMKNSACLGTDVHFSSSQFSIHRVHGRIRVVSVRSWTSSVLLKGSDVIRMCKRAKQVKHLSAEVNRKPAHDTMGTEIHLAFGSPGRKTHVSSTKYDKCLSREMLRQDNGKKLFYMNISSCLMSSIIYPLEL